MMELSEAPVPIKLKRASVACKRCRRLRIKCSHSGAISPCAGCLEAGSQEAAECHFPLRGSKDNDREARRRRPKRAPDVQASPVGSSTFTDPQLSSTSPETHFFHANTHQLPSPLNDERVSEAALGFDVPFEDIIEGCKTFISSYHQLGFIAKTQFLQRLRCPPQRSDLFFLNSILSVSSRFTRSLITRYGGGLKATKVFTDRATALSRRSLYEPTVQNTQSFFLLGLAEWGSGEKNRSCMHMGIAVRMASILGLHREETYNLTANPAAAAVIDAEVARRTFWIIQSQESLHSDHTVPAAFNLRDISALLPCEENDFAYGRLPPGRAALEGTAPALKDPSLIHAPARSLYAALLQVQNLWGEVARSTDPEYLAEQPWDTSSHYSRLSDTLRVWEENLAPAHRWSLWNLRGYKVEGHHFGFLSLVMTLKLCNIVLRRCYLKNVMASILDPNSDSNGAPPMFWEDVSSELFHHVSELDEQITAFTRSRTQNDGFPTEIVFCVYICGLLASYLWQYPQLCPRLAQDAEDIFHRSTDVLRQLRYDWPMALQWENGLRAAGASISASIYNSKDLSNLSQKNHQNPIPRRRGDSQSDPFRDPLLSPVVLLEDHAAASHTPTHRFSRQQVPVNESDDPPTGNGDIAAYSFEGLDLDMVNALSYGGNDLRFLDGWGLENEQ